MQKNIIKKQAEEKLQALKELLMRTDIQAPAAHSDIKEIQHCLQEAARIITVYEYLLAEQEIAHDFDVHLKIMEESSRQEKKEEEKNAIKETLKQDIEEHRKEEVKPVIQKAEKNQGEENGRKPVQQPIQERKTVKKLEISINDKFRMINELFHQNQQEYNIAIEQLNAVHSWEEAQLYINSLISVYNWDENREIVKTLRRLTQKRFV